MPPNAQQTQSQLTTESLRSHIEGKLTGKVVLVTGAGRGLGWGVARAVALAGAHVAVTDVILANITRTVQQIGELDKAPGEPMGRVLDTADRTSMVEAISAIIERWGRLDAVIHCAINMPLTRFIDTPQASFWKQMEVGLGGLVHATQLALPHMTDGGHVVTVASGSSLRGYHDESVYCAIKHAQEGLIKSIALEWAHDNVNVAINSMGPGKPIKPTRLTWEEMDALPSETTATWVDPLLLGGAFVWLLSQPPKQFCGLRFDAGPIVDAIAEDGFEFEVTPERVTLYPDDFKERLEWMESYTFD
jgi:NAD(P)-dependent dehydrogenase (short-subunit alcohol dehydrogenase family)